MVGYVDSRLILIEDLRYYVERPIPRNARIGQTTQLEAGVISRMRILRAAISQFSKSGYLGASMREIAKAAGVNEVTLFRMFSNKRNLYLLVLQTAIKDITPPADLSPPAARTVTEQTALENKIEIVCSWLEKSPESCRLIYSGLLDSSDDVERLLREQIQKYVEAVVYSITPSTATGANRCHNPRALIGAMLAAAIIGQPLSRIFLAETASCGYSLLEGIRRSSRT